MATGRVTDTWHLKDRKTRSKRYGVGKRWQAVWSDDRGTEEKRSFEMKDAAKAWIENKVIQNSLDPNGIKPDMPFTEYWNIWRAAQLHQRGSSLKTIDSHAKNWILKSFKDDWMHSVDRARVQAVVNEWAVSGLAASTVHLMYRYVRGMLSDAALNKQIREFPCVKINIPASDRKRIVPLSTAQVQQIVNKFEEPYRTAAIFAAATGLRPAEWRGLTAEYVDLRRGVVVVEQQEHLSRIDKPLLGPLKNDFSYRDVTIGPKTCALLEPLVAAPGVLGLIFHVKGTVITGGRAVEAWKAARLDMPWMGPGWHQLRHHHASMLIAGGASSVAVAHRLGHKDANETLRTYGHLWADDESKLASMSDGLVLLT